MLIQLSTLGFKRGVLVKTGRPCAGEAARRRHAVGARPTAVDQSSAILPHPPLPLAAVSIGTERVRPQNDGTLANGSRRSGGTSRPPGRPGSVGGTPVALSPQNPRISTPSWVFFAWAWCNNLTLSVSGERQTSPWVVFVCAMSRAKVLCPSDQPRSTASGFEKRASCTRLSLASGRFFVKAGVT